MILYLLSRFNVAFPEKKYKNQAVICAITRLLLLTSSVIVILKLIKIKDFKCLCYTHKIKHDV